MTRTFFLCALLVMVKNTCAQTLFMDVTDGKLTLVGSAENMSALQVQSKSASLVADEETSPEPFNFFILPTANQVTWGVIGSTIDDLVDLNGTVQLDVGWNGPFPGDYVGIGVSSGVGGFDIPAIPEPSTALLFGLGGLLAFGSFRQRRLKEYKSTQKTTQN